MTACRLAFCGDEFVATLPGGLWWPAEASLFVADLHLEKGSSLARRGALLPPYDSRATLDALGCLIEALSPRRVLCLGDSFHDGDAASRLPAEDAARLGDLSRGREWLWITGNHDPAPPAGVGGEAVSEAALGPVVCRHQAVAGTASGEISGHFHPKASLSVAGKRLGGRCFVSDGRRLILPSFGAFTGGLDVFDPAIRCLLSAAFTVHLLGRKSVVRLSSARLHRGCRPGAGPRPGLAQACGARAG